MTAARNEPLVALRRLLPAVDLAAIEINAKAVQSLRQLDRVEVHHGSIIERHVTRSFLALPDRPGEIIVSVNQRGRAQNLPGALERGIWDVSH